MMNAEQVQELQNSQPPTDWSKFDGSLMTPGAGQPGGLPPGMGPPWDDKLHVRFFMRPRIDVAASQAQNRPIYKDVPHIEIMIPGDKNNIILAEVWEQHIRRFPRHWEQFQAGIKDQVVGTPLRVAPFLTEAQVEELAYFKIRTVEQLADMPDSNLSFMGARELKNAAQQYLLKTNGNEALMARMRELESQLSRMGELEAQLAAAKAAAEGADDALARRVQELETAPGQNRRPRPA
jgi:hypothetical protein